MKYSIALILLLVTGCASIVYKGIDYESQYGPSTPKQRLLTQAEALLNQQQHNISFTKDVKPILDSR